jgi:hypothetical protein
MFSLSALSSLRAGCLEMRFLSRSPCCFIVPRAGRSRARMIGKRVHALFTAFIDDQGAFLRRVCMHHWGASSHQLSRIPECSSQRASVALLLFAYILLWALRARPLWMRPDLHACVCVCGCMEMEENTRIEHHRSRIFLLVWFILSASKMEIKCKIANSKWKFGIP